MKLHDVTFHSCAELATFMGGVSPAMAIVQLEPGPMEGRLRVFGLGGYRATVLEVSQTLFLSGQRSPERFTPAFELGHTCNVRDVRAQGAQPSWDAAFYGFNWTLTDFDLRLPAGSRLVTLNIPRELQQIKAHMKPGSLTRQRLVDCNLLEMREPQRQQLTALVERVLNEDNSPTLSDELLSTVFTGFEQPDAETGLYQPRQERHVAALKVLHRYMAKPKEVMSSEELCAELAVSRSALVKGTQEHFNLTPTQLQRAIRLDRVRMHLRQGEGAVGQIATEFGFSSRSHFAKRYREQFEELPNAA